MTVLITGAFLIILVYLILERRQALRDRAALPHVIHVNGIRGKSTVTRLIEAGLRAGGWRVFCKTTGTLPMTIGVDGTERPIRRPGKANIKEQLGILHQAVRQNAEILVIECMAVDPVLQYVAQHEMLRADIGVITNVRLDHTAEMGETLEEICDSLSNTIPRQGHLFTADNKFYPQLAGNARKLDTQTHLALPTGEEPEFDFPENLALALAVCRHLGVEEKTALSGMLHYQRDPYALSLHRLPGGGVFINGMSINDPQSTQLVFDRLVKKYGWDRSKLTLVINNRHDRGYRTQHMMMVAKILQPSQVWLLGAAQITVERSIRRNVPGAEVVRYRQAEQLPLEQAEADAVIFAVGNLAGPGHKVMERIRKEGQDYVS